MVKKRIGLIHRQYNKILYLQIYIPIPSVHPFSSADQIQRHSVYNSANLQTTMLPIFSVSESMQIVLMFTELPGL